MKYGDNIFRVEGVVVEVRDGSVAVDIKGRLGFIKVPKRMVISDYDVEVGQEVAWNMSYIEQESPDVNPKYVERIEKEKRNYSRNELLKSDINEEE